MSPTVTAEARVSVTVSPDTATLVTDTSLPARAAPVTVTVKSPVAGNGLSLSALL